MGSMCLLGVLLFAQSKETLAVAIIHVQLDKVMHQHVIALAEAELVEALLALASVLPLALVQDRRSSPHPTTTKKSSTSLQAEGFSPAIVDTFFRPFLGGIFFDRSLRTSR